MEILSNCTNCSLSSFLGVFTTLRRPSIMYKVSIIALSTKIAKYVTEVGDIIHIMVYSK